ncbi:exonuclease domain-containing protein [Bifidobacterium sp. SO1]|uniref:exonuclease domain-containing protein n=1 Tax=Bifidobacterium sp. SO1 TaxID=2809029 RepID=UPI001BDC9FF6|nr:exonuclease domain-containing protein [Bifidobacterium sp. SO1]MBT1162857.1 hypothetical protein [Bifidobacterium sp. SO1]
MPDLLLWTDIETTGLDETVDPILELGMRVTDFQLQSVEGIPDYASIVLPTDWKGMDDPRLADYTRQLHGRNRLLWELDQVLGKESQYGTRTISHLFRTLIVNPALEEGNLVYMAGSTVAFDRRFLDRQMPGLLDGVHHRMIDVSCVAELARHLGGVEFPLKTTDHRVEHCLDDSKNMYRRYMPLFHKSQ